MFQTTNQFISLSHYNTYHIQFLTASVLSLRDAETQLIQLRSVHWQIVVGSARRQHRRETSWQSASDIIRSHQVMVYTAVQNAIYIYMDMVPSSVSPPPPLPPPWVGSPGTTPPFLLFASYWQHF